MGAIEESFPELAGEIQMQRNSDGALDEICKDFELLTEDLRKFSVKSDADVCRLQSDLRTSLEGLRQEILTKLQRV